MLPRKVYPVLFACVALAAHVIAKPESPALRPNSINEASFGTYIFAFFPSQREKFW